jgi:hypothetical protein
MIYLFTPSLRLLVLELEVNVIIIDKSEIEDGPGGQQWSTSQLRVAIEKKSYRSGVKSQNKYSRRASAQVGGLSRA